MISARLRALTANSKQLRTENLERLVGQIQRKKLDEAKRKLQTYPPPIPSSDYVRTGDLGRGWEIRGPSNQASGIMSILVNTVGYSGFVQGNDQQSIFSGRWTTIGEAVDRDGYHSDLRSMMKALRV